MKTGSASSKGSQWDLSAPLMKDPAKKHLRSLRLEEEVMKNALAFDLMPLAHGIDCAPGQNPVFERDGHLVVNSYRPPRIRPAPGGLASRPSSRPSRITTTAGTAGSSTGCRRSTRTLAPAA